MADNSIYFLKSTKLEPAHLQQNGSCLIGPLHMNEKWDFPLEILEWGASGSIKAWDF